MALRQLSEWDNRFNQVGGAPGIVERSMDKEPLFLVGEKVGFITGPQAAEGRPYGVIDQKPRGPSPCKRGNGRVRNRVVPQGAVPWIVRP